MIFKKVFLLTLGLVIFPSLVFADAQTNYCSSSDYTLLTINGVLTDETGAKNNMNSLGRILGRDYNNEKINVDFLWNPPHFGGAGDFMKVLEQGIFDDETVLDYDLENMLQDARDKIKTQKLLLVAHSQGNFYANSFYDVVTDKDGGVPNESIGVYSVATPSGRVAGGGKYLTSTNDRAIAKVVRRILSRKIMEPNIEIPAHEDDEFWRHDFTKIYLKYAGSRIVSDIQGMLSELKNNEVQKTNESCINPPNLSLVHKVKGLGFAVGDWLGETGISTLAFTGKAIYLTGVSAYQLGQILAQVTSKAIDGTVYNVYSIINEFNKTNGDLANNSASVILASEKNKTSDQVSSDADQKSPEQALTKEVNNNSNQIVMVVVEENQPAPSVAEGADPDPPLANPKPPGPKIIFVGPVYPGFGGGSPQTVPVAQTDGEVVQSVATTTITKSTTTMPSNLAVPIIDSNQCSFSFSIDGCLLATTTLQFSWTTVANAEFYNINKNGTYSTTTATTFEVASPDFSDYTFEVSAGGDGVDQSATSTQIISVATIPIAINEIAWMGTKASASDEWLELKNNTKHTIDLSQWEIQSADGAPRIVLFGTIRPNEYLVFERTDDNTITDVLAYQIYTGSLGNSGEELILSHASTTLDRTPAISGDAWTAGSNISTTTRTTMERYASTEDGANPANWSDNLDIVRNGTDTEGNTINGTPGARNSVSYLINKGQDIADDLNLGKDESVYIVTNSISVMASSTLSLEPGVIIKFQSDTEIDVLGKIQAEGSSGSPVTFESFDENQSGQIIFESEVGTSTLINTRFENTKGLDVEDNAKLKIVDTDFINNRKGVEVNGAGTVTIENSSFASSTNEVIAIYGSGSVSISSSTIDNTLDSDAVGIYSGGSVTISSTTISNTIDGDAIGVYGSSLTLASSTIDGILDGDAVGSYNSNISISSSTIENGAGDGVYISGGTATIEDSTISGFENGTGVNVSAPEQPVEITNTDITGNETGVMADSISDINIEPESKIHDNGTGEADNIVTFD